MPTAEDRPAEPTPSEDLARWRRIGLVLLGLEALAPLVGAAYGLVQLVSGNAVVERNEAMLVVLLLVAGLGLGVVAWGVAHGRRSVRTASLVWQVLLVLGVVPALWQADRQVFAVAVTVFVVAAGYATVRATVQD